MAQRLVMIQRLVMAEFEAEFETAVQKTAALSDV
jgi:hypothetical protein